MWHEIKYTRLIYSLHNFKNLHQFLTNEVYFGEELSPREKSWWHIPYFFVLQVLVHLVIADCCSRAWYPMVKKFVFFYDYIYCRKERDLGAVVYRRKVAVSRISALTHTWGYTQDGSLPIGASVMPPLYGDDK